MRKGVRVMKDILFSDNLYFHTYVRTHAHHTHQALGAPRHFLAYIEKGSCRIVSDTITVEVLEGELFYIPKGLVYHSYWYSQEQVRFLSFGFQHFPESGQRQYLLQKIPCEGELLARIRALPTGQEVDSRLLGNFYSIVAELLPRMQYREHSRGRQILEQVRQYINTHTDCKVPDIAKHCLLSEAALYDIFRQEAGMTPNQLRQQILCEKAVRLLATTDRSVQEISDSLHFSSASYFRKILYQYTGKTPRQIRQLSKNL